MDFKEDFLTALQSGLSLTKSISIHNHLPNSVTVPTDIKKNLPYIQGFCYIKASFPYYYELAGLNSYCLLLTEQGSGILDEGNDRSALTPGSFAFIDCNKKHRLEIKQSPWHYKAFFISGDPISFLHTVYYTDRKQVYSFSPISPVPHNFKALHGLLLQGNTNYYLHSKCILDIVLETLLEKKQAGEQTAHLPDYLVKIKQSFDVEYEKKITLDLLEEKYQVSKYQICRDFTAFYGYSPIQYLNHIRILVAKEALLYTDKRINEIGRMTGFENTNHFIRMFKQKTGITPLSYRKAETLLLSTLSESES